MFFDGEGLRVVIEFEESDENEDEDEDEDEKCEDKPEIAIEERHYEQKQTQTEINEKEDENKEENEVKKGLDPQIPVIQAEKRDIGIQTIQFDENAVESEIKRSANGRNGKSTINGEHVVSSDTESLNIQLYQQYGNEANIEKEINKRKLNLEYCAEKSARVRQAQWVRDRISLEQAIDELFSDHIQIHEKAHALRLHFEREKLIWSRAVETNALNHQTQRNQREPPLWGMSSSHSNENHFDNEREHVSHVPDSSQVDTGDEFEYNIIPPRLVKNSSTYLESGKDSPPNSYEQYDYNPQNQFIELPNQFPTCRKYRCPVRLENEI